MADASANTQRIMNYWISGAGAAKVRWGTPGDFDRCVSHLRDKVEPDPNKPRFVLTVRGVGYSFSDRSDRGERSGA